MYNKVIKPCYLSEENTKKYRTAITPIIAEFILGMYISLQ